MLYKFADDQGTYLAAQITYYGFVAAFPLHPLQVAELPALARATTCPEAPARAVRPERCR